MRRLPDRNVFNSRLNFVKLSCRKDDVNRSTHADQQHESFYRQNCCVRETPHVLSEADQPLSDTSSARYAGAWPDNDWCTRHATLYSIHPRTGSRCNWRSTGVMIYSYHGTRLASATGRSLSSQVPATLQRLDTRPTEF